MKTQKPCGVLNVREKGGDERWWSPDRDLTVIYPRVMREVFYSLSNSATPVELEIFRLLKLTEDDIGVAARLYSRLISCVEARENIVQHVQNMPFRSNRVMALLGMVFLRRVTELFAEKYSSTLHRGEPDPNHDNLQAFLGKF